MPTGIRRRMIAYYLVVIAVVVVLMGAFFIFFLHYFYMQSLRDNLFNQARLASVLVEEMLGRHADREEIDRLCKELRSELGVRLTLVLEDGTVLADSDEDPYLMDNHRNRPEIIAALKQDLGFASRYSVTLGEEMYYLAVPLWSDYDYAYGEKSLMVMRLALPLASINRAIFNLVQFILGALLLSSLFALAAAVVLSQRITGPIAKISRAAGLIAEGDFSPPLNVPGNDELSALADNLKQMGRALNKKIDQVIYEKTKVETVVSSMSSGIILTDCALNIELVNPAAEELFDFKRADVIGKPFNRAVRYHALHENLKAVCRHGEGCVLEVNLYYPRVAVLDTYIIPVETETGEINGALLLFHETTQLRSLEKMRSDFVANASHELRTPLTTVRGYAETILHEKLSTAQLRDFLKIIERETLRLSVLLDDLLDLARIENEKSYVVKEKISPADLLGEAVQRVEELKREKDMHIEIRHEDLSPGGMIFGNYEWLCQALVNILENSIRHGRKGGKVTIILASSSQEVTVTAADNGPGIPEADLPYVFERFYRVDKARSRKSGGTGLGLSIVKHIMEAHGALYGLESREGEGTVFYFTLPRQD